MDNASWIIAALSIVGVILNIKKNKFCFVIWAGTNGFWTAYDYSIGAYAQAALFGVYFTLALWGLWEWEARPK